MLGSAIADYAYTLESGTAGAGIAWLKSYGFFDKPYYAYDNGSLQSVNVVEHITRGKNWFDKSTADANRISAYIQSTGTEWKYAGTGFSIRIPCEPNTTYTARYNGNGTQPVLSFGSTSTDVRPNQDNPTVTITQAIRQNSPTINTPITITTGVNDKWLIVAYTVNEPQHSDMQNNLQIEVGSTATDYAEYTAPNEYPLADLELRGVFKMDSDHNIYAEGDTYESSGKVTRNTILRAYQSGNESLTDAITDGTNTIVLSPNASTEQATPFTNPQTVDKNGTEQYIDGKVASGTRDVAVPVGHETEYKCESV